MDKFQIDVLIGPLNIESPQVGDKWLMRALIEAGYTRDDKLLILNWVRCHQQTLFLLDVLDAGGKNIDSKYLNRRPNNEAWSSLVFPIKKPLNRHISLWREALQTIAPRRWVDNSLGQFTRKGHKIWEWRYDRAANRVLRIRGNVMDIYRPSEHPRYVNRPNFWTKTEQGVAAS